MSQTIIGELVVNLKANTASLVFDLDKIPGKAKTSADGIKKAFDGVNFHEAQGGLKLLEESMGISIPRHLNALITKLPGLGTAFAEALPIVGIVIAGQKILELVGHLATLGDKQDELARNADQVARAWQESGAKIQAEIDAQEAKIIALSQGAVAGFEYAFAHAASVAIAHLKDIDSQVSATAKHIAESGNWFTGMASASTEASEDLKNFNNDLNNVMTQAEANSNGDKFAAIRAGLDKAGIKANELAGKIKEMHDAQTQGGQAEDVMYAEKEANYRKEADAIDNVIRRLNQLSNLQAGTNAEHNSTGAAMRVQEFEKAYQAEKAITDARTKETIAAGELEFTQGKITAEQLSALKQSALDAQYALEVAHFERLKVLDAGRPEILKQVLAQEATLEAQHAVQVIDSYNKALEANKKGISELEKINTEQFNQEVAGQTKLSDATFKGIEERAKRMTADANLIQGEGNKKIAATDAEIRNLQRLIEQYKLTGKAKQDVDNAIHALAVQRQADEISELLKSKQLGDNFHGVLLKMAADGQNWHTKMASQFEQSIGQMNQSIASFITTGKFNFASLAQSAASNFIEMALQYGESKLEMELIDKLFNTKKGVTNAGMAQSNVAVAATEALASVPWPENMAAAAETEGLGQAFAAQTAVGFFERGGEVPDGYGPTAAMLHPREMVLPAHLADVVRSAAANNGGGGNNGAQPISMTTNISALAASAEEITGVLKPHILKVLRSEARNRYMRS